MLYRGADDLPYWAYALRTLFRDQDAGFYPYYLSAFAGLLAVIGLPVALSGAVLPLMFHALRERVGDLGDVAGRLYSWNTLGSLLGALIGGYALLFWLDLHHTFRIAMAAIAVAAALSTGSRRAPAALARRRACCWAARSRSRRSRPGARSGSTRVSSSSRAWSPRISPPRIVGPDRFFADLSADGNGPEGRELRVDLSRRRSDLVGHGDREDRWPRAAGPRPAQQRKARGRHGGIRQDHAAGGAAAGPARGPDGARLRGRLRTRNDGGRARLAALDARGGGGRDLARGDRGRAALRRREPRARRSTPA